MTSLVPQSFIPGYRLQSGTDLNVALANPQWSTSMTFEATTGGTAATSAKIVNTITNITSATAGAGVTIPRAAIGKYLYIINSSPNTVFVYAEGDATINGNSSYSLATGQSITLYGVDTTSWEVTSGSASVNVDDFGAKGDAQFRTGSNPGNATISLGSTNFTYSVGVFTANDIGKTIWIQGAGAAGDYLVTTIAGFTSATNITLADPALTARSNTSSQIMWAFDDTAAFNAAIAATDGEVCLNPNKTYAVNLNLTKRGTILNGNTGAYQHALPSITNNVYNLIPFDRTKPVIQLGDGTGYSGGILIENMVIYNPLYAQKTTGNIGIYLGPGAYGNWYQNLSITEFTDFCVKLQGSNSELLGNYLNYFSNCYFGVAGSTTQNNAVLGMFYGTNGYGVTTAYFSNMIFRGPQAGNGLTFWSEGCDINISQAWVQWVGGAGAKFEKITSGGADQFGRMFCTSVNFEGVTPNTLISCESTYDTTGTVPPIFGTYSISGSYRNASAVDTVIYTNNGVVLDKTLYISPIFSGLVSLLKAGVTTTVMNYDSSNNFIIGQRTGTSKVTGNTLNFRDEGTFSSTPYGVDWITASQLSQVIRPNQYFNTSSLTNATSDGIISFGAAAYRWKNVYSVNFYPGAGTAIWTSGTGSPEGVVTAPIGSLFTRTDSTVGNTTLYVKESGSGNTGWVAK